MYGDSLLHPPHPHTPSTPQPQSTPHPPPPLHPHRPHTPIDLTSLYSHPKLVIRFTPISLSHAAWSVLIVGLDITAACWGIHFADNGWPQKKCLEAIFSIIETYNGYFLVIKIIVKVLSLSKFWRHLANVKIVKIRHLNGHTSYIKQY